MLDDDTAGSIERTLKHHARKRAWSFYASVTPDPALVGIEATEYHGWVSFSCWKNFGNCESGRASSPR